MAFHKRTGDFKVLETKEQVIALATEFATRGGTPGERPLNPSRLNDIRQKLFSHEDIAFNWALGEVPSLQQRKRVDGQHSAHVFLTMTAEDWQMVEFPLFFFVQEFECDTTHDLAHLFEQFNAHWSSRSQLDLTGFHLAIQPELHTKVSREAAYRAVQGITWYLTKLYGYKKGKRNEHLDLIHKNGEYEKLFLFFGHDEMNLNPKVSKEIAPQPVVAAIFHTIRQGTEDDKWFWRLAAGRLESIPDQNSYHYKLAKFLRDAITKDFDWPTPQRRLFSNKQNPNATEIFVTCLRTFAIQKKGLPLNDVFIALRDRNIKDLVSTLYPLPSEAAPTAA
jgi:hypothetical protein